MFLRKWRGNKECVRRDLVVLLGQELYYRKASVRMCDHL
jgi:hypothetical protein